MFKSVIRIHFVGIGGIGMSGIAEILQNQGFIVTGSDIAINENTTYLEKLGIKIHYGHSPENIKDAEVLVYSSAVNIHENPEIIEAKKRGIPILRRAEMLAEISRMKYSIAIAGTHGKTTTTSMIGLILIEAGLDPTVIVGGRLKDFGGTNARLGNGNWIVVEADEYDRSFLQLLPTIAVVNNIEPEHMDIYRDYSDLIETFSTFSNKIPFYGFVAVGLDDNGVKDLIPNLNKKVLSYGLSRNADFRADNLQAFSIGTQYDLLHKGEFIEKIILNIPGIHNVKNSLAAITVAHQIGVEPQVYVTALSKFKGVYRRFDIKGEARGVLVVDDYAHHPTEIQATLQAARKGWDRRIIAVFQPHTYSRTQKFYKEFARSFDDADVVVITDVYPARELPIEGVDGKLIADNAVIFGHKNVFYIPNFNEILPFLKDFVKENDMVVTIGAGNIVRIADSLFFALNNNS